MMRALSTIAALLFLLPCFGQSQSGRPMVSVDTVADLVARNPVPNERVLLSGLRTAGDFGAQRIVRHVPASVAATNLGCVYANAGSGRYLAEDCESGEVDARWFGAAPFQSSLMTPWAYQTNIAAIGTGDFSVWARLTIPASVTVPIGYFSIFPNKTNTAIQGNPSVSAFSFRATPSEFGFLSRGTNASATPGTTIDDASLLNTTNLAGLSSYTGRVVDFVFTRSGTNVVAYIDGTNINSLLVNDNLAGWAKSVGLGYSLTLQIGAQENGWYWPNAITRFALWRSALNSSEAADPDGTGSKSVDWTPEDESTPSDSGPAIQAAIDYAGGRGGGVVRITSGKYRISTGLRLKPRVFLSGSGASLYPAQVTGASIWGYGASVLIPWFGDDVDIVSVLRADQDTDEGSLTYRLIAALNSTTYGLMNYGGVSDIGFFGGHAHSGRAIFADRVGALKISKCSFSDIKGSTIYSTMGNVVDVTDCYGVNGRGWVFLGGADNKISGNFCDGPRSFVIRYYGNLSRIYGNVFEVAQDPSGGASPWEDTVTADATNDVITVANAQGHRLRSGDVVRFTTTGTLPAPLAIDTDYFVTSSSLAEFQVYTNYADEVTGNGALLGVGAIDITDVGSGTHSVTPGPAVGFWVTGDNNQISANISHFNWENGLLLDGSRWNSVSGNSFVINGYLNPDTANIAGVKLVNASYANRIVGNGVDDRNVGGANQIGIETDVTSYDNLLFGNSYNVDTPYVLGTNDNYVADSEISISRHPYHRMYLPMETNTFFAPWAATYSGANASGITYHRPQKRLFLSGNTNASLSDWDYSVLFNGASANLWNSGSSGGTLSMVNNTVGSNTPAIDIAGQYANTFLQYQVSSTTAAQGVRQVFIRNNATNGSSYGAISNGQQIAETIYAGYATNTGVIGIGAGIESVAGSTWTSANYEGRLNFNVTPASSIARATQVQILDQGRIALTVQYADPTNAVANGQIYYNAVTGKFRGRAAGSWVDLH